MNFSVGEFTFRRPIQYKYKTALSTFKRNINNFPSFQLGNIENRSYAYRLVTNV